MGQKVVSGGGSTVSASNASCAHSSRTRRANPAPHHTPSFFANKPMSSKSPPTAVAPRRTSRRRPENVAAGHSGASYCCTRPRMSTKNSVAVELGKARGSRNSPLAVTEIMSRKRLDGLCVCRRAFKCVGSLDCRATRRAFKIVLRDDSTLRTPFAPSGETWVSRGTGARAAA